MFIFPKIPEVNVKGNLEFRFTFDGHTTYVPQASKDNGAHNTEEAMFYGKLHAKKVYWLHYLKRGHFSRISIQKLGEYYTYNFSVDDTMFAGAGEDYEDALAKGIDAMLGLYDIEDFYNDD